MHSRKAAAGDTDSSEETAAGYTAYSAEDTGVHSRKAAAEDTDNSGAFAAHYTVHFAAGTGARIHRAAVEDTDNSEALAADHNSYSGHSRKAAGDTGNSGAFAAYIEDSAENWDAAANWAEEQNPVLR